LGKTGRGEFGGFYKNFVKAVEKWKNNDIIRIT
jgi:hypothetical protein